MELKEFVSKTLIQIIDGVKIAQDYAKDNNALVSPRGHQAQTGIDYGWREKNYRV